MKKINFSIATIAAISIASTLNASSLEEVFKNGKVNGAIQAYYFAADKDSGADNDIATLGFDLSYETGNYNGFTAKTTFQSASSPWADEDGKAGRKSNMWGSGSQLSEAYLSYANTNTSAKIGRMYFWSPLLGGSGSRVNKEAFQGIAIKNSDIPGTIINIAYMNRFQSRTDRSGNIGEFTKTFRFAASPWAATLEDGAYTIALNNKSIKNLTLTAAYVDAVDVFKTSYLEASYKFRNFGIAGQYYNSKQDGQESGNLFGIKADTTFGNLSLTAAYTTTDDKADVIPGIGNGADLAYTWSEALAYQYAADQDSSKVLAKYKFNKDTYVSAAYLLEDGSNYKKAYTNLVAGHKFSKALDLKAAYEIGSKDASQNELRVRLNYNF